MLQDSVDIEGQWKPLILLVPVRLGLEKFNSVYAPPLTALFSLKQGIGIIGGRPKHSMYFIGFQGDYTNEQKKKNFQIQQRCSVSNLIFLPISR